MPEADVCQFESPQMFLREMVRHVAACISPNLHGRNHRPPHRACFPTSCFPTSYLKDAALMVPRYGVPRFRVNNGAVGSSTSLHTQRYRAFLDRLRQARVKAGMTQAELAQAVRRSQTWVSKCELGERRVDIVELEDLAEALGKPTGVVRTPRREGKVKPNPDHITLRNNLPNIKKMLLELILRPRRDLAKWAEITKQTPNIKIGYPGQHLASLVTGVEGSRSGARGHDLCDESEVKSCSRVDQLDKCKDCMAAVARIENECPGCRSTNIKRNNDSKWLLTVKSDGDLRILLDHVPRIVFIISDYLNYEEEDWTTLQFQVFEIWPGHRRHAHFRRLIDNYLQNIYLPHIRNNPNKTPAPKNFWPYSFQFYMCNPVRTFRCVVRDALDTAHLEVLEYVEPLVDRATVAPGPMPLALLNSNERSALRQSMGDDAYRVVEATGLDENQRLSLVLRDTDHASPQARSYQRGVR